VYAQVGTRQVTCRCTTIWHCKNIWCRGLAALRYINGYTLR